MGTKKETVTKYEGKATEAVALYEKQTAVVNTESEYTVEELVQNAEKLFNTRSECVAAAFKEINITKCTISNAQNIVHKFMAKEVK